MAPRSMFGRLLFASLPQFRAPDEDQIFWQHAQLTWDCAYHSTSTELWNAYMDVWERSETSTRASWSSTPDRPTNDAKASAGMPVGCCCSTVGPWWSGCPGRSDVTTLENHSTEAAVQSFRVVFGNVQQRHKLA